MRICNVERGCKPLLTSRSSYGRVIAAASPIPHPAFRVRLRGFLNVNPFNRIEIIARSLSTIDRICLSRLRPFICMRRTLGASRMKIYLAYGFTNDTWPAGHARHFLRAGTKRTAYYSAHNTTDEAFTRYRVTSEATFGTPTSGKCVPSSMPFIRATFESFSKVCSWNRRPKSGISVRVFATFRNDEK